MSRDTRGTDIFDKLHEYGVDLKRRRIFMQTPFCPAWMGEDAGWSDMVVRNLLWLDGNSKEPIELWLHTPGGYLDEMWAVYDAIRTASSPIITVCLGNVSSAGCLILAAGTGTRYAMPRSSFMWHGGWESASLSPREMEDRVAYYKRERALWIDTMARHTTPRDPQGRKLKTHKARAAFWEEQIHDHELWRDAEEMIADGIVDEIWEHES